MKTRAAYAATAPIPAYQGNTFTWTLGANYDLTKKIALSAGLSHTLADAIYDYTYFNTFVGMEYKINDSWSADCRYSFLRFDENGADGTNNYFGSMLTFGMVGKFK